MILQDKVSLVTGGTAGIGQATAIAFGAAGAKVVFSDIRGVESEETADFIREAGAECLFAKSDVSSEADVDVLEWCRKRSRPTADSIVPLTMLALILLLNHCMNNQPRILGSVLDLSKMG
ncbi:SDR family NAD(P)-dependent oxidoreductase [Pseudanabaena sp. FACHB-2040]|uniref:SDR family NAD(P)-dependent oxidoreductase n=1 Tax=Pseudanabaena sp. FACHB-2040 TaxID=2692859 RepID=UPI001F54E791|nr:SDR family NAD(P)-dependent oxidoreductase [Pseudanabaena sp. FACHB-2040]